MLDFEWDPAKAWQNRLKHGVTFEDGRTVYSDPLALTVPDLEHSTEEEERFLTVGISGSGRLLVVVSCERGTRIRIISAREATRQERKEYEENH